MSDALLERCGNWLADWPPSMPVVLEPSWMGRRVTVRRVVAHSPDGPPRTADVVGDLVALDAGRAVVDSRTGLVEVALADVVAAKPAPPSTRDELDLEATAMQSWRAAETATLGAWVLRANDGFTKRANSALPLGQPGTSVADAIERVQAWYHERDLPARFQLPVEGRRLLDAELGERGWEPSTEVHVLTARLDLLDVAPPAVPVESMSAPDDDWLAVYRDGEAPPAVARALLTRHDDVTFAAVRDAGRTVAIGRATIDDGRLGITAVEVDPALRRRGLARAVMSALHAWGRERGAVRAHLAVEADNTPAVALYDDLGYALHHDYRFRTEPSA